MEFQPQSKMYEIITLIEEINNLSLSLNSKIKFVFDETSLPMPKFKPAELGFLRVVSWLYVYYFETGKVGVDFLSDKFSSFSLDENGKYLSHKKTINILRTYLQHNLDISKPRNCKIMFKCQAWLNDKCRTSIPNTEKQWELCLEGLLKESEEFLNELKNCIRRIEKNESRDMILKDWEFRLKRNHPPHEFDEIINIVAKDIGREYIDSVKFRKRFYDKWIKELENNNGHYDFSIEARKLVEHAFLSELVPVLPITGKDIISLDVEPGPKVGELLKIARKIYERAPCSRDELLDELKNII